MRDLLAAGALIGLVTIGALGPTLWPESSSGALATPGVGKPAPTFASVPPKPPVPAPTTAAGPPTQDFPQTDRPVELSLPSGCRIEDRTRHHDGQGATWRVQCGSANANLHVAVAAMRQGWERVSGPPIGVGLQAYTKGSLTMQVAYRLDGPAYSDPFVVVQYARPVAGGGPGAASPFAYLRTVTGFELPRACAWGQAPAGFTDEGAYKLPFECAGLGPDAVADLLADALASQGWTREATGAGPPRYAKAELRLWLGFAQAKIGGPQHHWVVMALCCFAP